MALKGIRVVEMAGLAPGPMCGMILADFGADVIRVDKTRATLSNDTLSRGKRSIAVNLKDPKGINIVKNMIQKADVLIEPFRAGVMEKLELGPDNLCRENQGLIYARLTGYGQTGPYAKMAGHDINYIATSGVLSTLGRANQKPHAPINLLADFAGGGLTCAFGILVALFERTRSGKGQVIDASMVEGAAYMSSFLWLSRLVEHNMLNIWGGERGENLLDGGYAFYDTYETKDGKYMAVGPLEPQFYSALLNGLGLSEEEYSQFGSRKAMSDKFTEIFASKTRADWTTIFDGTDACVTPVTDIMCADLHPHNAARKSFMKGTSGAIEPVPAPILSRTPGRAESMPRPSVGQHTVDILRELNIPSETIDNFLSTEVVSSSVKSKL